MGRYDYYLHKVEQKKDKHLLDGKGHPVIWAVVAAVAVLLLFVFLCWIRIIDIPLINELFSKITGNS